MMEPNPNMACGLCGGRRYDPIGPHDGYIGLSTCDACTKIQVARALAKRARDQEKLRQMRDATIERRRSQRENP